MEKTITRLDCYGKWSGEKEECRRCNWISYCKDAVDIELIGEQESEKGIEVVDDRPEQFYYDEGPDNPRYTPNQVCYIIHQILLLDDSLLRVLRLKILNPGMSDEQIGKVFNITRQAVFKQFKKYSAIFPQFKRLLNPDMKVMNKNTKGHLKEANDKLAEAWKFLNKNTK